MNPILPIIAIFILVIILFFLSQIIVKIIWHYKTKLNSTKAIENLAVAIALFFLFLMLMFAIYSAINVLTDADASLSANRAKVEIADKNNNRSLNLEDCQQLINEIYVGESKVYNSDNHRYIEVVASEKDINASYQEGAKALREIAKKYLELDLNSESEYYSKMIGNKLKEKAKLFEQRGKIIADNGNRQKINQLLDKMDQVTEERLNAIESVENQCN